MKDKKQVTVIGAGFGGLQAVKKLSKNPNIHITLIDRKNHHLFQPLLYQVATAVLSPADIAIPIRSLIHRKKNVTVLMDEVTGIDKENKFVLLGNKKIHFDYLIISAGAKTGYFGIEEWKKDTSGLKNLHDALIIRNKLLLSFEEAENNPDRAKDLMNYIIIGGGPTGVELAGSIAELAHNIIRDDFRNIDTRNAVITLIEAGENLLPSFDIELSKYTKKQLEKRNVTVYLNSRVKEINGNQLTVKTPEGIKVFSANIVIWAAGVEAVKLTGMLDSETDRQGRLIVNQFCSIDNHTDIFVIGDIANFKDENGKTLPGVSAVAMQQGRYVAGIINDELKGVKRKPFKYFNKGNMATIGRKDAVAELGTFRFTGFTGWILWLTVHLFYQVGFKNKISILITWIWSYITFGAGARVIQEPISERELNI